MNYSTSDRVHGVPESWTIVGPPAKEMIRLRHIIIRSGLWKKAPCCLCGYNGPGYFQPGNHECAKLDAELAEKKVR